MDHNRMIRYAVSVTLLLTAMTGITAALKQQNAFAEDPKTPENMVLVPGGKFLFGEGKKETSLKAFYIDKYEVTNEDFKKFREEHTFSAKEGKFPVRDISFFDAEAYCKWAGKRLPTEEEWEKAARGTDGRKFPWGEKFEAKRANTSEAGGKVLAVGSFEKGASPYGVHDMAGNVWEWTDSWFGGDKKYRVMRGGSYFEPGESMAQVTKKLRSIPDDIHEYLGFRCVKSAE